MKKQHISNLSICAIFFLCCLFVGGHATWAAYCARIISQTGEVKIAPDRERSGGFIELYPGDTVTVKGGLAVIEYSHALDCGEGTFGAVILGTGETHVVQTALDVNCKPTDEEGMSRAFREAGSGEQRVTLCSGGKADADWDNTDIFQNVLDNKNLKRGSFGAVNPSFTGCNLYKDSGFQIGPIHLPPNTEFSYVGDDLNDEISSVEVAPGCTLEAFWDSSYEGAKITFSQDVHYVGDAWNDQISSVKCTCLSSTSPALRRTPPPYTIQQKSTGRYLDAHEDSAHDYTVVTRAAQNNDSQQWIFTRIEGSTYTIQQKSTGRYLDAHEDSAHDYTVVTRTAQNNDSQQWIFTLIEGSSYTIQQKSTGRYLDAHEDPAHDYTVVTRPSQNNKTQQWVLNSL